MNNNLNAVEADVDTLLKRCYYTLREMRDIDDKHWFEQDDEVGEVFRRLADIVYERLDVSDDTTALVGNRLLQSIEPEWTPTKDSNETNRPPRGEIR
jgi:hypothetical protein